MLIRKCIAIAVAGLCCVPVCRAAVIHVPDQYAAIQDAIAASSTGDVIIVRPGIYFENLDFLGKAITVMSEAGPENTTIDGGRPADPDAASVVSFRSGEDRDSVLEGFTITNGWGTVVFPGGGNATYGGGIYCESAPAVRNNIIKANAASIGGGVACRSDSGPLFSGNTITLNVGGGIDCSGTTAEIIGNTVTMNSSHGIEARYATGQPGLPRIAQNLVTRNQSVGINCKGLHGATIASNRVEENLDHGVLAGASSVVVNNIVRGNGACGILLFGDEATIRRNTVSGNGGAGIESHDYSVTILDCIVSDNLETGVSCGGGTTMARCVVTGNVGAGIACAGECPRILGCTIAGTVAGPGVRCAWDSVPRLMACRIVDNGQGGGIACFSERSAIIMSCLIAGNHTGGDGGGISFLGRARAQVTNCTFAGNTAAGAGGGLYLRDCALQLANCIVWGNEAPAGAEIAVDSGSIAADSCDIRGGWPGSGNLDADPLFVDCAAGDFHLTYESPCREGGNTAAVPGFFSLDFEEDERIAGTAVDIGADEFCPHLYFMGGAAPGATIEVKVIGAPGAGPVRLLHGAGVQTHPVSTSYGDLYLRQPIAPFDLGVIAANGVAASTASVPNWWAPGETHPFQALIGALGVPGTSLTNLVILEVE